jgi:hypothetical protein
MVPPHIYIYGPVRCVRHHTPLQARATDRLVSLNIYTSRTCVRGCVRACYSRTFLLLASAGPQRCWVLETPCMALRCLDRTHPRDCGVCLQAPSPQDVPLIQLHSSVGPRAGEQRLRHLLVACPEWSDGAARDRLVSAPGSMGSPLPQPCGKPPASQSTLRLAPPPCALPPAPYLGATGSLAGRTWWGAAALLGSCLATLAASHWLQLPLYLFSLSLICLQAGSLEADGDTATAAVLRRRNAAGLRKARCSQRA